MKNPVILIALQEFTLNRRNKWVASFAGIFAFIAFFISYFGMVTSGYSGFQDFARTSTSLINLVGFILPLFALVLGTFSFISNKEYLELMVSQPISRYQVILGKYFGLLLTMLSATLIGFAIPGIVISLTIGVEGALSYALVILFSILLTIIFTGCAVLISQIAKRQQIALGITIGVWIFFEVIYGLIILGTTLYFTPVFLKHALIFELLLNPIDIYRVLSLLAVGGAEFFGPAGASLIKLTGSEWIAVLSGVLGMVAWSVVPIIASIKIFSRQNL
ncbi:MAG: ABC transporter permease subunit [Calditrichia bacterium]|nr:ABC transporter permease subunit [Calditrichia bacterium]